MSRPTKTQIEKAIRGVAAAGKEVEEVRVCENGELRLFLRSAAVRETPRDVEQEILAKLGRL